MKPDIKVQRDKEPVVSASYGIVPEAGTVRLERVLPGPIERIWAYLTESEKRGKWFASGHMELRAGGELKFHFHNSTLTPHDDPAPERYKNSDGMTSNGRVTRCEPPHLLSFNWTEESGDDSEVTFELTEQDGQVLMLLTHRRLRNREEIVSVASGWHVHVGILIDLLNGQEPMPFWATYEKLATQYEERIPVEGPAAAANS